MGQGARGLGDVFAVANSLHGRDAHAYLDPATDLAPGERHDHLADAAAARAFLRAQGMTLPPGDPPPDVLDALRTVRTGLSEIAAAHRIGRGRRVADLFKSFRYRLEPSGRFRPEGSGWRALIGELLVTLAEARVLGDRLKRCANPDCGWFFVDVSKNRSREWCEMRTCGNRANLRRYRERLRRQRRPERART